MIPENPYEWNRDNYEHDAFEEGGEAYTKALIGWLLDDCIECEPMGMHHKRHECKYRMQELKDKWLTRS